MKRLFGFIIIGILVTQCSFAQIAMEKTDTVAINKIKDEGMDRSQVMEILSYLTDVYGPRLTGSPEYNQAAEWVKQKLTSWGLQNVYFDKWGPFGKGWSLKRFSASVLEPMAFPVIAYPKAWTPGLKGTVRGNVVYLDAKNEADLEKYKGKLKGAFVLISDLREIKAHLDPEGIRLTDADLLKLANAGLPVQPQRRGAPNSDSARIANFLRGNQLVGKKLEFCLKEGAAVAIDGGRGDGGTIFVSAASVPQPASVPFGQRVSPYDEKAPAIVPQVTVAGEHYNRMVRAIQKGQKIKMEMNLEVEFTKPDSAFNIIAEIPGTDLKDEVVMVGGHFDSWHAGTGATDDGTGSAVCMEALRIIKTLGLQPRRTIRIGLWAGEEQGLLGSRAYVKKHFGEREGGITTFMGGGGNLVTKAEHAKLSVYFNHDNGTGKFRGVYMQGNEAVRPIFQAWLAPFASMGASTLTLSNTGGTDHLAYDAVGLPGFQFIQDPVEYDTRTHHSNMDVYDRVQEEDMRQASVIMAAFAYNAAMRDAMFPRKPMPAPRQPSAPGGN